MQPFEVANPRVLRTMIMPNQLRGDVAPVVDAILRGASPRCPAVAVGALGR